MPQLWSDTVPLRVTARERARSARDLAAAAALSARDRVGTLTRGVRFATADAYRSIPVEARRELRSTVWRLRKVRTPGGAARVIEDEIESLLRVVTPVLVEHPLPIRNVTAARAVVGTSAALAAAGEELGAIATLVSEGAAAPVTMPVAIGAVLVALVLELHVAVSLRVHTIRAADGPVDPEAITAEAAWAMAGAGERLTRTFLTRRLAHRLAARYAARWARGVVPIAGAAYAGWDAQRTVEAIASLPVPPAEPLRVGP
jgi:hypothetical protein